MPPGYSHFIDRETETPKHVARAKWHIKEAEGDKNQGLMPTKLSQQDGTSVSKRGSVCNERMQTFKHSSSLACTVPVKMARNLFFTSCHNQI